MVAAALANESDDDWLHVQGRELYWLPVGKLSDAALDFRALRVVLGQMTVRTKNTVERLVARGPTASPPVDRFSRLLCIS